MLLCAFTIVIVSRIPYVIGRWCACFLLAHTLLGVEFLYGVWAYGGDSVVTFGSFFDKHW